jgi:hypothetical protein
VITTSVCVLWDTATMVLKAAERTKACRFASRPEAPEDAQHPQRCPPWKNGHLRAPWPSSAARTGPGRLRSALPVTTWMTSNNPATAPRIYALRTVRTRGGHPNELARARLPD